MDLMDGFGAGSGAGGSGSRPSNGSLTYAEVAASATHVLVGGAGALLARQVARPAADFERDGGFTERLHRMRRSARMDWMDGRDARTGDLVTAPGRVRRAPTSARARSPGPP